MEDKHIVSIDLGSSKIALTVAKVNFDDIQVIYYREVPSDGIRDSYAYNSMKIVKALEPLVADAEKELNIKITQAVVGMPKFRVRQVIGSAKVEREDPDTCISEKEINELKAAALSSYPLEDNVNEKLFGAVAQSFSNGEEFQLVESDIIGIPSDVLEGNFKMFIGKSSPLKYIDVAFNKLGIAVARKYFTPDSLAKAVLTQSEMENGVALIDFGGGATSVSVYSGSIMRHYASIPFGGHDITTDIKTECSISDILAENIKMAFGACMPEKLQNLSEKTIHIDGGATGPNKQLPVKYLSEVISARVKEIVEAMLYEIEQSGYADRLRSGVVLTGGVAELTNCANYIKELSGYTVRKGFPRHLFSVAKTGCDGIFETSAAVSAGLVLTAVNDYVTDCIAGESTIRPGIEVELGAGAEEEVLDNEAVSLEPEVPEDDPKKEDGYSPGSLFDEDEIPTEPEKKKPKKSRNTEAKPKKEKFTNVIWTLFTDAFNNISNEEV